jgi:hypothetical protein
MNETLNHRNPARDEREPKGGTMSDTTATPTPSTTPKALAAEIGIDPKVLRSHLRKAFTRPAEAKNTTWLIPDEVADEVRAHFEALKAKKAPDA